MFNTNIKNTAAEDQNLSQENNGETGDNMTQVNAEYNDRLNWSDLKYIKKVDPSEELLLVLRQHPIILILRYLGITVFIILFTIAGWFLSLQNIPKIIIHGLWLVEYILVMFSVMGAAMYYHNYILSKQVITNRRLIDIDQQGLFHVETNDLFLDRIQAVNLKQKSFLELTFNYGSVDVETAGEGTKLSVSGAIFENIPNPRGVVDTLNSLMEAQESKFNLQNDHPRYA